jgi:hypothetical protein
LFILAYVFATEDLVPLGRRLKFILFIVGVQTLYIVLHARYTEGHDTTIAAYAASFAFPAVMFWAIRLSILGRLAPTRKRH